MTAGPIAFALKTGFMSLAMNPRTPVASSTASATFPVLAFMKVSMISAVEGAGSADPVGFSCARAGTVPRHKRAVKRHSRDLVTRVEPLLT
ncbi:MAG: hypothetical protein DMF81_23965 [Acidobacteria bacterium]|nr:MAG: hypothetical protein DMF81_23965 [Acidobacteriota bacterium]